MQNDKSFNRDKVIELWETHKQLAINILTYKEHLSAESVAELKKGIKECNKQIKRLSQ